MASYTHTYDSDEKELEDLIRKDQDEAIKKITNSNTSLAILVAGGSNNGKSSVVSQVFGLNVGIGLNGAATTTGIKTYTCEEKHLLLIDTPGLEKKNNDATIARLRQCKPDILWLILNYASAIEEEELAIAELFPDVPTIVILNKVDTLQINKLTDEDIEHFDSTEAVLPEKLRNNSKLIAVRQRLIDWKLKKTAKIQRILIMSLRNELPTDHPVGIVNLCQATWMSCSYVASVTFTQAQNVWKGDKVKGSIGIILSSTTLASGCAWIPIPGVDFVTTAGVQWGMLCGLCKLWGMSGDNVKIFLNVMTRNAGPVLASLGISYTFCSILKFFPGLGSIAGGSANSYIAGTSTLIMGSLATLYLKSVHHDHSQKTESELEQEINRYIQSARFKIFLNKIKEVAKNPTKINRNELARLMQDA